MQRRMGWLVMALLACSLLFVPIHSFAEGEQSDTTVTEQGDQASSEQVAPEDAITDAPADELAQEATASEGEQSQDEAASTDEEASQDAADSEPSESEGEEGHPTEPTLYETRAACVTDTFGNIIWEYNGYEELPMASITKVMTAMVALDSGIPLDTPIEFVKTEFQEGAQLANYAEGDTPTFDELLKVTLIYSGNDAALNVAYAVAGSQEAFADLMNAKAAEIGMTHTHFVNPHGLEDDGHYSCATDLCIMGRYAMEHYPYIRTCVQTPSVTIVANGDEVTLYTTDHLMDRYAGLRGIKTGNTESGASFLGSARRYHNTLYSCVLCCDTTEGRFDDTERLLDWAFDGFDYHDLASRNRVIGSAPWNDGFWLRCPVSARQNAMGTSNAGTALTLSDSLLKPGTLAARDATYGTRVWRQDSRLVASASYVTGRRTTQDLAWSPLMLPVMTNTEELIGS